MADQPSGICSGCGGALPDGAAFCPTCAAPAARAVSPSGATPPVSSADSRNWAMAVHLTALAGAFIGGIGAWVGPLVIWLMRRDSDPFAAEHAREGLNFNITVVIGIAAALVATLLTLGLGLFILVPLGVLFGVMWLVWTIQATIAASRGEHYRYPISIRLIR